MILMIFAMAFLTCFRRSIDIVILLLLDFTSVPPLQSIKKLQLGMAKLHFGRGTKDVKID